MAEQQDQRAQNAFSINHLPVKGTIQLPVMASKIDDRILANILIAQETPVDVRQVTTLPEALNWKNPDLAVDFNQIKFMPHPTEKNLILMELSTRNPDGTSEPLTGTNYRGEEYVRLISMRKEDFRTFAASLPAESKVTEQNIDLKFEPPASKAGKISLNIGSSPVITAPFTASASGIPGDLQQAPTGPIAAAPANNPLSQLNA
ncbi:MAG: hypothetical protein KDI13_02960 [Alphaproteobacteria bacterium]|nr:hypothetical protein [Alphaproteobacteria bacterium]